MKIHQAHKLVAHNVVNFAEKCLYPPSNQNVTYKPLFMELRFQEKIYHKRMPFYMFGDTIYLGKIPEADWVSNICSRFNKAGITISEGHAEDICRRVECYSSCIQQLAPLNEFCP